MDQCAHPHHHQVGSPSSGPPSISVHAHSLLTSTEQHHVSSGSDMSYQSVASAPTSALVEMLSRIDALEAIPRLQVEDQNSQTLVQDGTRSTATQMPPRSNVPAPFSSSALSLINTSSAEAVQQLNSVAAVDDHSPVTSDLPAVVSTITILPQSNSPEAAGSEVKKSKVGRPRSKPQKEKTEWHQHLGGVRHCRVPLTPELREVLEVAYVSKIMSKNFRKEGQPEKERIAKITGMELEKVQEWFKNRRKKDKLLQERTQPKKRGRPSNSSSSAPVKKSKASQSLLKQALMQPSPRQAVVEIDTRALLSQIPQQTIVNDASHLTSVTSVTPVASVAMPTSDGPKYSQLGVESSSSLETLAGHELPVASSIELTM